MRKWVYEALYRLPFVSVDLVFGSTADIERLAYGVADRVTPGRAMTLGCGVGRESIALARRGFEVTGLDFSRYAIDQARLSAADAGVSVDFVVDDLTDMSGEYGTFDLITDFGALNDLSPRARESYLGSLLQLTRPGTRYFMFCFRRKLDRADVERLFSPHFAIEAFEKEPGLGFPRSLDCYLMTRRPPEEAAGG